MKRLLQIGVFTAGLAPMFAQTIPSGSAGGASGVNAPPSVEAITRVLERIHGYLAANTPVRLLHRTTGAEITDTTAVNLDAVLERGAFNPLSYEWGTVYAGMLLATEATGDARFRDYVEQRMKFIATWTPVYRSAPPAAATDAGGRGSGGGNPFRAFLNPAALTDAGPLCAAMIKVGRAGIGAELQPLIDIGVAWVYEKQERLADGSLMRSRPQPRTLWLDDLYMGVPALAEMGKLTGRTIYFDEAVKQVTQFAARMFNREKKLWMHGWVEGMEAHPEFHWGRANGFALLALTELLGALPETHPGRGAVLDIYRTHVRGLAETQDADGRWHQLLDRPDSYRESSATAMFAFCIARGVNRGWLDAPTYGPIAARGWQGLAPQVNPQGQLENVCVGTGMEFNAEFYLARPVSAVAPHGPGAMLLAGAEMIALMKRARPVLKDGALIFERAPGM